MNGLNNRIQAFFAWLNPLYLTVLVILSAFASIALEPLADPSNVGDFASTLYAINLTSNILTLGIPITFGSVIMWNTEETQEAMAQPDAPFSVRRREFITRYLLSSAMTFVYMTAVCVIGFILARADTAYLPGILLAALVVSLILSAVTSFIAIAVDSPVLTLILTSAIFLFLSSTFGYSVFSADGLISLFAPYHLFRFLAVILSGYEFLNESVMQNYLGIAITPVSLLLPLIVWVSAAMFSAALSIRMLHDSMKQWSQEGYAWEGATNTSQQSLMHRLTQATHRKREIVTLGVIVLFLSAATFNLITIGNTEIPEDLYLYRSPATGENIALGWWRYDTVVLSSSELCQSDGWTLRVTILDWGAYGGGEGLRIRYGFLVFSISAFSAMNDTEREGVMTSRTWGLTPEHPSTGTGVSHGLEGADTYLWALRVTDDSNENATYVIRISIALYLIPM
jgi:hypothetical protein